MSAYKITSIGSARMDIFAQLPDEDIEAECGIDRRRCVIELGYGEKIPVKGVEYWVGGNGANVAVGMKRLGIESLLVAELGQGMMADNAFKQLENEGIGMEKVTQTGGVAEGLGIVINYQAERTILSYYSPSRPDFPSHLPATEWAYLTSVGENFVEYYAKALSWIRTGNAKLAFNPGGRQIKEGREWMETYLKQTEVLLVNREEAAKILTDQQSTINSRQSTSYYDLLDDIKAVLLQLWALGPKTVVVTDGPGGAYGYNGQVALHMPILDAPVVERTGCGDAFSTGFLAGLMNGHDMETALKWGTVNSASVIGKVGPEQGLLRGGEIDDWLERMKDVRAKEV